MKNYTPLLVMLFLIASCDKNSTSSKDPDYTNACCCNTIFTAGSGKVFIPSMFSPNGDGIDDRFSPLGDTNIVAIYDVLITNPANTLTHHSDTFFSPTMSKSWDGFTAANKIHKGIINVSMKVLDKNNVVTSISAQSCSFICDEPLATTIPNHANCKFEDQLDYLNFTLPYTTKEPCFK